MEELELLRWAATLGSSLAAMGGGAAAARLAWRWASGEDAQRAHIERMHHTSQAAEVETSRAAQPLPPQTYSPRIHFAPHYAGSRAVEVDEQTGALPSTDDSLPGMVDMADLDFQPTMQRVLLGIDAGGGLVTVPAGKLCHVAIAGHTGGGKSNLLRLLIPQLQAIGARVVLCDPHYAPLDTTSGDDWRPIAQRLHQPPAYTPAAIDETLSWFVDELDRRLELRRHGQPIGVPLFLALDELPIIADSVKGAIARLGRVLREGRKAGVLALGSSQDFLVKSLGGSSAVRDCYRTAFYSGGDINSARALLDVPQKDIDEGRLGSGIAYLRSSATSPAALVRVPLATNRAVRGLLADTAPTVTIEPDRVPGNAAPANGAGDSTAKNGTADTDAVHGIPDDALITELVRRGKSANEICRIVGGSRGRVLQRVKKLRESANLQQNEVGA
jgi:hypothetical protein